MEVGTLILTGTGLSAFLAMAKVRRFVDALRRAVS